MVVLLFGYEPFLEFSENPSMIIAQRLNGQKIKNHSIVSKILPVDYSKVEKEITESIKLVNPDLVVGPGYMFHHDFISMYGAKLYAIGTLKANFDFDNFASTIPFGFTKRKFDEVAFNSIVMTGLVSILPQLSGSVRENTIKTIKNIENEIDSRVEGGGLRRGGNYFHLRESWPTFFYTYASQLFATHDSLQ